MTEPAEETCGAEHPSVKLVHVDGDKAEVRPLLCEMPPGTNACTEPVIEIGPLGDPIVVEPRRNVHVHKGFDPATGAAHRWEDA